MGVAGPLPSGAGRCAERPRAGLLLPVSRARSASPPVDFGRVKTGVAVSSGGLAPRPLPCLRLAGASDALLSALVALAQRENATARAPPARVRPL